MESYRDAPKDVLHSMQVDLPVPLDDGACNHLEGLSLPSVNLVSSAGSIINPAQIQGWGVIYCYPMTGRPGREIPDGWAHVPGAAGCTLQSRSFRVHHEALRAQNTQVFGLSAQSPEDQKEASIRLELPYPLLSDSSFHFAEALNLPFFEISGLRLIKRVTLIVKDGIIKKFFYPVFPPDKNIDEVLLWLKQRAT